MENSRDLNKKEYIDMIVKVTGACTRCRKRKDFYVPEHTSHSDIKHVCENCGNNVFTVVYR